MTLPVTWAYVSIEAAEPEALTEIDDELLDDLKEAQNQTKNRHFWSAHFWALLDCAVYSLAQQEDMQAFHNERVKWWASADGISMSEKLFAKMDWESVMMAEELDATPRKDADDR